MDRPCDVCGQIYEAKRPTSKFCGSTCRMRASRGHVAGPPVVTLVTELEVGPVESAALAQLRAVERESTTLGLAAIALAHRVDAGRDTGAGLASLVKQLEATVKAATADVRDPASPLDLMRDELAQRRKDRSA